MPRRFASFSLLVLLVGFLGAQEMERTPGYDDTPLLPGQEFRVHDWKRPHPPCVAPPVEGPFTAPPGDAVVLFAGEDLSAWRGRDGDAAWRLVEGAMEVNGTGDIRTRASFGDCQLHLEWRAPAEVAGDSQGRGNSGLFLMDRYEIQILDSHDNVTYADGQAAALYGQKPPRVNACRPPGTWQVYDVVFRAPRCAGEEVVEPARVTVFHNGVLVHHDAAFLGPTAHRRLPRPVVHAERAPVRLQDHGNPVRFRNVWIRPLDD